MTDFSASFGLRVFMPHFKWPSCISFWLLWINDATVTMEWGMPLENSVFSFFGSEPNCGITGLCGNSFLIFWESSALFSEMVVLIYSLTRSVQEFLSLHIPVNTYIVHHLTGVNWSLTVALTMNFFFPCVSWIFLHQSVLLFFGEMSSQALLNFVIRLFFSVGKFEFLLHFRC